MVAAPIPQPSVKLFRAMTSSELRWRPDFVSQIWLPWAASYIGLTKGLTTFA
jgi:hypothetical protein